MSVKHQLILFDTEDGLFLQVTADGNLNPIAKDDDGVVNIWNVFDQIEDVKVLEDAMSAFDPKTIPYDKYIKNIIYDMMADLKVNKFDLKSNGITATVYGTRVKNHVRKYIEQDLNKLYGYVEDGDEPLPEGSDDVQSTSE